MTKFMTPAKARGIVAVRAEAPADIKVLLDGLQKDWKAFKDAQAEKDCEVKARFDDVVTTEKFERINASVGELQAAVDQANAQIAAMSISGTGSDGVRDQEYSDAFRAHFRKGEVQASLNKGTDSEGGYLAPVEWDRTITDKLVEVSPMRSIASVQSISTAGFKKLFNLRGTGSGWVGETAARPETTTPTFGEMSFAPGEIYANPAATQAMLDDAEVDLEAWIAGEVQTEFAKQEGLAFVSGNGTNKPAGFLTFAAGAGNAATNPLGAIAVKTAASATALDEDELLDLIYGVPSSYTDGARFVMNRTTMGVARKLRDNDGRQLWQPSMQAGQPSQLLGYPVTEMADMPDIATGTTPIAFGNFARAYLIVDRTGVRVQRDPFTQKPYVLFYTTKRVGGGVVDPQGLHILKML
ncbi:phage major capsid protein [Roseovarius sp. SCSIO 43702]|uniref:phage major capsid protein n=1 Tax=Roseovarius sp. SCSIO 43702 TaxID=2823043 RepID=UPI001C737045|nr:phage major capsid protein [Roseovarius sp. SCSIO 43702]QYX58078.1 phage major capsid protein [Roseovarius sp. SCSIO 43702]